jgi:single-stranded-DNA-specific exonuclease
MRGVRLLSTNDPAEATRLAEELELENRRRRDLDAATLADVLQVLEREYDPDRHRSVVLASDRWHPGVIGIVASRVVELVHRPVVLFAMGEREGRGSGRSIPGFHLQRAFAECASHLIRFGGHRAAAGCSLLPHNLEPFRRAFEAAAARTITPDLLTPQLHLDGEIALSDANADLFRYLRHFAPFGMGNPTPVFAAYGVQVASPPRVVGKNNLRVILASGAAKLEAIGFGMADRLSECTGTAVDVAFRLEENRRRGRYRAASEPTLQARLMDIRAAV